MAQEHRQSGFITIEGIEGVGKSTAVNYIKQLFDDMQLPYISTREPGGTAVAEQIRQVLLTAHQEPVHPETELLLMFASRAQHINEVILPALEAGKWVICDRFTDASYAYQGAGRGLSDDLLMALEQHIQKGLQPDLTLLLDASYEVSQQRMQKRKTKDRIEREDRKFFDAVRHKYHERAAQFPERYRLIQAEHSLEQVQQQIKQALYEYIQP